MTDAEYRILPTSIEKTTPSLAGVCTTPKAVSRATTLPENTSHEASNLSHYANKVEPNTQLKNSSEFSSILHQETDFRVSPATLSLPDANDGGLDAEVAELLSTWNDDESNDEDEESGNAAAFSASIKMPEEEKTLAVSSNRTKSATPDVASESARSHWMELVMRIGEPLSTILSRGKLGLFTRSCVEVTLPTVFQKLVTPSHLEEIDRYLARNVGSNCRINLRFSEIGDDADTVAAERARQHLEAQEASFDRVREHPMMKKIIALFHVNPDVIRFTINPDRTTP